MLLSDPTRVQRCKITITSDRYPPGSDRARVFSYLPREHGTDLSTEKRRYKYRRSHLRPRPSPTWENHFDIDAWANLEEESKSLLTFFGFGQTSATINIRHLMYKVNSLQRTFDLRFKQEAHVQTQDRTNCTGIEAIQELHAIAMMFRPDNIISTSSGFRDGINVLHKELADLDGAFSQAHEKFNAAWSTMSTQEFIFWAYSEYRVKGVRTKPRKRVFRYDPDSTYDTDRDILDAIKSFSSAETTTRGPVRSLMSDVVVDALKGSLKNPRANAKPSVEKAWSWLRKKFSKGNTTLDSAEPVLRAPSSEDRLTVYFPLPT